MPVTHIYILIYSFQMILILSLNRKNTRLLVYSDSSLLMYGKTSFENNSGLGNILPGLIMKKFLSSLFKRFFWNFYFSLKIIYSKKEFSQHSSFLFILTFNKFPSHPLCGRCRQHPAHILLVCLLVNSGCLYLHLFENGCGKVGCAVILTSPGVSLQPMSDRSCCINTLAS